MSVCCKSTTTLHTPYPVPGHHVKWGIRDITASVARCSSKLAGKVYYRDIHATIICRICIYALV